MAKLRIYELARELGVENKVILERAKSLGLTGKTSHSNSLEPDEADLIRRDVIRQAIGQTPDTQKVKTRVDSATGEEQAIVESRKGNVIRRRKKTGPTPEEIKAKEDAEKAALEAEQSTESEEVTADNIFLDKEEEAVVEAAAEVEEAPVEVEEVVEDKDEVAEASEEGKKAGPRVLGKIDLPVAKPIVKSEKRSSQRVFVEDTPKESEGGEGKGKRGKGRKKRARKREFSRGDLVDYENRGRKKPKSRKKDSKQEEDTAPQEAIETKASKRVVKMDEFITVGELAKQMSLKSGEVISKLIEYGMMATINQAIDQDTTAIICEEFGFTIESTSFDESEALDVLEEDTPESLKPRPPVVTVMGHVDHGKTSLLDKIRNAAVVDKEHGGITQHIGAYSVDVGERGSITFIDTPGHAAFTSMRARGAQVTDIVILVVAADDGVMPQTEEAINHAKAADVGIVVAVNKMDKPNANPDKVKQQLAERGLQPEDWGGDTMFFPVSALQGDGVDELLEGVLLVSEMRELKANPDKRAVGTIIEVRQERGRGTVCTVLVQGGTLKKGDIFVSGAEYGRIRSMSNHNLEAITEAGPSTPVEITGLNGVPEAGDDFIVVPSESAARQVAENRLEHKKREQKVGAGPISLEEFAKQAAAAKAKELNVVVKADVDGSLGAVKDALERLSTEKVKVQVVHAAVGGVTESDVQLATASRAIIVGFGVRAESRVMAEADENGIDVRFYRIIYELIDDIKGAMVGLLAPIRKEKQLGVVEIRETYGVPKIGTVAGCFVKEGKVPRGANVRLLRDSIVVHEGKMGSLRRFKDDVKEVQSGYECGMSIDGYNDIKIGDVIEVFEFEEIAATLD